ncbi:MAG TPA: nicotinamide riboside transporter PnuC [Gemmatimonadaceae bacterium]|nr:nicotinamide riboside transporter PnuC [Gemmatimonadaceae bacterium]
MNPVEMIAVAFGLVSVWLAAREHILNWPTAIINVGIFFVLFWQARLYADAVLQLFYLSLSVYGWWAWLRGGAQHRQLHVAHAGRRVWTVGMPMALAAGAGLGFVLRRYTDSPVPFLDATLTTVSLLAQWMMTRKLVENWVVWIVLDLVYVPMFVSRGLPWTSVQYAVFLALAWLGYAGWRKSLAATGAVRAAAA